MFDDYMRYQLREYYARVEGNPQTADELIAAARRRVKVTGREAQALLKGAGHRVPAGFPAKEVVSLAQAELPDDFRDLVDKKAKVYRHAIRRILGVDYGLLELIEDQAGVAPSFEGSLRGVYVSASDALRVAEVAELLLPSIDRVSLRIEFDRDFDIDGLVSKLRHNFNCTGSTCEPGVRGRIYLAIVAPKSDAPVDIPDLPGILEQGRSATVRLIFEYPIPLMHDLVGFFSQLEGYKGARYFEGRNGEILIYCDL